jgi:hypothetical protein
MSADVELKVPFTPLTHATLALVEQQRIANLIALGEECVGPGRDEVGRSAELRPDVRDGLGLS